MIYTIRIRLKVCERPPSVDPSPAQLATLRHLFARGPVEHAEVIKALWRALVPGLAQVWYRFVVLWRHPWPYKLLNFIRGDIDLDFRMSLAMDLIHAKECCFGHWGSIPRGLYDLAMLLYYSDEERIQCVLGPGCTKVVQTLSTTISTTIHDLESLNAVIKRSDPSPPVDRIRWPRCFLKELSVIQLVAFT